MTMLRNFASIFLALFVFVGTGVESAIHYEGLYAVAHDCSQENVELHLKGLITAYLPYNPVIVDIGSHERRISQYFAKTWLQK